MKKEPITVAVIQRYNGNTVDKEAALNVEVYFLVNS